MKQEVKETLGYIINGISIAVYFFLLFAIGNPLGFPYFEYIGWILLGSGIFLILVSSYALIRNRGKGLIDWGIYGIVRHPMYVGAILIFLSWTFLLPHWLTLLLTLTNIAIVYWFILQADRQNIGLFGSQYEQYMESVPRVNILAGFLKSLRKG